MPNLDIEREHLRLADQHIATAKRCISALEMTLVADASGILDEGGQAALLAAREGLKAFDAHRELIVATISDVQAGYLPNGT